MSAVVMASVKVITIDILMKGTQSMVNETADEENKWVAWWINRGNKQMGFTSFVVVVMYHHKSLKAVAIAAIAARR